MAPRVSPQGDVVNYDEIKRFIRQELGKMFDGNGAAGARGGRDPPSPAERGRIPRRAHGVLHIPAALPGGDGGIPGETGPPGEGRAARAAGTPRFPGDAGADR